MTLDLSRYDFADFGCSDGKSLLAIQAMFPGVRGVGLDIDPRKVEAVKAKGLAAEVVDLAKFVARGPQVRFVVMYHFLEHLAGRDLAFATIKSACALAREFVYVRQPWFDADGYLFMRGLKFYWSDWTGHRYHMQSAELHRVLGDLLSAGKIANFAMYGETPVLSSADETLHPLASPPNQHKYDPDVHSAKPATDFPQGIFRELGALVAIKGDVKDLEKVTGLRNCIFRSGS